MAELVNVLMGKRSILSCVSNINHIITKLTTMKVLICVDSYPLVRFEGGDLQLYNIIKNIDKKIEFYLLYFDDRSAAVPEEQIFDHSIFKGLIRVDTKMGNLFTKAKSLNQELSKIITEYKIDLIITRSNEMSIYVSKNTGVPNILNYVDSRTLLWGREFRQSYTIITKLKSLFSLIKSLFYESFIIQKFQAVVVVSQIDKNSIERRNKKVDVRVIPNGVNTDIFRPSEALEEDENSILFFGSMNYLPNIDAAIFIHSQILPLIVSKVPNIKFFIVGRNPTEDIRKLADEKQTFVTDYIPDIRSAIQKSAVVLIPMRKGAGIKNKLLEAMSMKKAIVTTSTCAESLSNEAKKHLYICDTPEDLARSVISLLKDKNARLRCGEKNRDVVVREYSWIKASEKLQRLMESLTEKHDQGNEVIIKSKF